MARWVMHSHEEWVDHEQCSRMVMFLLALDTI